jgi:hypothetical protein
LEKLGETPTWRYDDSFLARSTSSSCWFANLASVNRPCKTNCILVIWMRKQRTYYIPTDPCNICFLESLNLKVEARANSINV